MLTSFLLVPLKWKGTLIHPSSFLFLSPVIPTIRPSEVLSGGSSLCSTLFAFSRIYLIRRGMVIAMTFVWCAFFKVSLTSASKASWESSLNLVPLQLAGNGWLHSNSKFRVLDALYASTLLKMTLSVSVIDMFVNCAQGCLTDGSNPCSIFGSLWCHLYTTKCQSPWLKRVYIIVHV